MAGLGQEDVFPRSRLSARYAFIKQTFAGTSGNEQDAPEAAIADCQHAILI